MVKCISILFNRLCWLPAFLLFICFSNSAFAAIAPSGDFVSTIGPSSPDAYCQSALPNGKTFKDFSLIINPGNPGNSLTGGGYVAFASAANGGTVNMCRATDNVPYGQYIIMGGQYCLIADGYQNNAGILSCTVCPSGTVDQGGVCVPETPCPDYGTFYGAGEVSGGSSSGCAGSCGISSGGSCISSNDPITGTVTSNWCSGWTYTGSSCEDNDFTGTDAPEGVPSENGGRPTKPSDCPPQTGYAEVNGVASCLPSGSSYQGGSATSTDSVTGNTTTINTTTTINSDGSRTTTTITNVYGSGGDLISTNTDTQTDGQIGDGKGKEDQSFGDAPNFDDTLPGEAAFDIKTQTGQTLSTEIFSVAASCPAPIEFEAMGQQFSITFQPICDLADIIRGIVLMLSAIAAIRIIVTGG